MSGFEVDEIITCLCSLQVPGVHERPLEIFDLSVSPLQQSLKLQVWLGPVQEHHHLLHLLSVGVEEVLEEVRDGLVGDVAAHHDVSHPLVLEGAAVLCPVAEQLHDLRNGGGEHGEADSEEQDLEASAQCGLAVDVSVAHSGHGHHQEVDTVPVGQTLPVVKVRRIAGVFKKMDNACCRQPDRDEHGSQLTQPDTETLRGRTLLGCSPDGRGELQHIEILQNVWD